MSSTSLVKEVEMEGEAEQAKVADSATWNLLPIDIFRMYLLDVS